MDRRSKFRQNLHPLYLPKYQALCKALPEHWQPYQGFRTFGGQDKLFSQGRTTPGKIVTHARGGESAHNYGCATDWIRWDLKRDEPLWIESTDPQWEEYLAAVKNAELKSGLEFDDIDHNEISIGCSWLVVKEVWKDYGMDQAMSFIQRMGNR